MNQNLEGGLTEVEIVKLIDKKKRRYCSIALSDIEEITSNESLSREELFKQVRKVVLDNMNSFTRHLFDVIGISVEGIDEGK